ncbi:MAG: metallophosphatase family protein [Syntrophobacterales bacterium]|nr:metallophosphatase family protein [Syntrophobacterales bacterium]
MKIYCFGDIHGNEVALEAVLRHVDTVKPDEVICLGDIVGWLPWGRKTLEVVMKIGIPSVAGNHDLMVAGVFTDHRDQIDRMQATAYTTGTLADLPDHLEYLATLPLKLEKGESIVVHFSPFDFPEGEVSPNIEHFTYLDDRKLKDSLPKWGVFSTKVILSGHDHLPALYELTEDGDVKKHPIRARNSSSSRQSSLDGIIEERLVLKDSSKYWVKAGAVGGPYRDGVPMANSVLYDEEERVIHFFRIPYDIHRVSEALKGHRFFRNIETIQRYIRTAHASWNR